MEGDNNSDIDDNLTVKIMFREIVYISRGLEAEYRPILLKNPKLLDDLANIRGAAKDALSDYGVFASKRPAPFTLKGLVDAVETVRIELEKKREDEAKKSEESKHLKDKIMNLLRTATRMILRSF